MQRITLLNPKGGCGKTTLATNLASFYARSGLSTTLIDHDAQGSSTRWLGVRSNELPGIHGIEAYRHPLNMTRTFHRQVPLGTERIIVDTPASIVEPALQDLVRLSDSIVIPVLSSQIDIDALERFTQILHKNPRIHSGSIRVAVVANRVRRNTRIFKELNSTLEKSPFDYVTVLRESQNYIQAGLSGIGIHDLKPNVIRQDYLQWRHLLDWLEEPQGPHQKPLTSVQTKWHPRGSTDGGISGASPLAQTPN